MPATSNIERHPLQPFLPKDARLLMLGSFPPPKERWCMDFFYPNPQNDMWRIMGQVFFVNKLHFCTPDKRFKHEEIVTFCEKQGIAIFDTAQAVIRQKGNASDEHLEIVEQTNIAALLQQLPQCHDICCTGGKAAETLAEILHTNTPKVGEYTETTFANKPIRFWRMPSTSRAYPLSLDKKAAAYQHMSAQIWRKRIEVVAAVIFDDDNRIFATQRGYGEWKDWWEFPGGKIETGETPRQALQREIREELDAEIEVGELMKTIDYDYPNFHLTMHCYKCRLSVTGYRLREHEAAKWLAPNELQTVQWLPADEDFIKELNANTIRIVFEEAERQAIAYDGNKPIGECQYNIDRTGKWIIMHTGVRHEYNGRGIAKRLVEKIIEAARERGTKIIPVCSYAQRMMSGKDEYKDVL